MYMCAGNNKFLHMIRNTTFNSFNHMKIASNYQLLKLTDEVLCKNQITYWIWGGTLIGTIRH